MNLISMRVDTPQASVPNLHLSISTFSLLPCGMTLSASVADGQKLLQDSLSVLTKAGKLQPSTVDTSGFPKNFDAREFKTPVRYIGNVADMDLSKSSLAGVWPSVGEVKSTMNFYFHDKRILETKAHEIFSELIEIRTTSAEDVRGKFQRTGDDAIVIAFLHKWALLIEQSRTEISADTQTVLERMSKASQHVRFRLIPGLGADPKTMFFKLFQAGEDAARKAEDVGNHVTFRRGERLLAFQNILKAQGEPHTNQAVYDAFKEQEAKGLLTYARKESRIEGVGSIQKILAFMKRAREADVYDTLKSLQLTADGQPTFMASWTVAAKLPTLHKSNEEFAWVANVLKQAMTGLGWRKLAEDLGGEAKAFRSNSAKDGNALQVIGWTFRVLKKLVEDLRLSVTCPNAEKINQILSSFVDWHAYTIQFVAVQDQTHTAHLGAHVVKAVSLLASIAAGDHYGLFKSIVMNVDRPENREKDPRLKNLLFPLLEEWKNVAAAHTVRLEAERLSKAKEDGNAEDGAGLAQELGPSAEPLTPEELRKKALAEAAAAEARTYVHFCVSDDDTAIMKERFSGASNPALRQSMPGLTAAQIDFENKPGLVFIQSVGGSNLLCTPLLILCCHG